MQSAVRRAQIKQGYQPRSTGPSSTQPQTFDDLAVRSVPVREAGRARGSERRLVVTVAIVALLVGAAALALGISASRGSGPDGTGAPVAHAPLTVTTGAATSTTREPTSTTSTTGTTTTTAAVPVAPGSPPQIASIDPASGSAGQNIAVTGSGFLSSDGHIVATFNGQVTATSCPSQNACTVTVPAPVPGESSAQVVITTGSGASNPATFSYQ
jgi:IPT/TIG domain